MNETQIKQYRDRLDELKMFVQPRLISATFTEQEIIDWIASCMNLFYKIGVDKVIVNNFLEYFSIGEKEVDVSLEYSIESQGMAEQITETVPCIGPFIEIKESIDTFFIGDKNYGRVSTGKYRREGSIYYINIAFSAAYQILEGVTEEKHIVPIWLFEQMSQYKEFHHISSSLELVEVKYKNKDTDGLIIETNTLLDGVLCLDTELQSKTDLGSRLTCLCEKKSKQKEFGISKELAVGLNCGRIIRNGKIVHKKTPLKYNIPFMIAASYAYLTVYFVELATLHGKVLSYDKI